MLLAHERAAQPEAPEQAAPEEAPVAGNQHFSSAGHVPPVSTSVQSPRASASELAYGPPAGDRVRAQIDAARGNKQLEERIMLALEDAQARKVAGQTSVRIELPEMTEDISVPASELDALLAYAQSRGRVARSSVATEGSERMAPTDVLYEQMAHAAEGHVLDQTWLALQGYRLDGPPVREAGWGLSYRVFVPIKPGEPGRVRTGARPVVAFLGTQMSDANDRGDDVLPQGVGWRQTHFNEGVLRHTLASLAATYGPVALAGHSLGGANAQNTAAMFPQLVDSVHTYQSPGVGQDTIDAVQANNRSSPHKVRSTHARVDADLVETVGKGYTEGSFEHYGVAGGKAPASFSPKDLLAAAHGAVEGMKAQHDSMLATRAWLQHNPDVAAAHEDLARSPTGDGKVTEEGRSDASTYQPTHERLRTMLPGSGEQEKHVAKQYERIEAYRAALTGADRAQSAHRLEHVYAMVDADRSLTGHALHWPWQGDPPLFTDAERTAIKRDLWIMNRDLGFATDEPEPAGAASLVGN